MLRRVKAAALFAAGVTLAGTAVGVAVAPAQAAATYKLYVSTHPNRSAAKPLAGSSLHGAVYIFALPASGALRINFYLDDPKHVHAPTHSEGTPPYDFQGGDPNKPIAFRTSTLTNGHHSLTIVASFSGGAQSTSTASFSVNNVPPQPRITHVTAATGQITVSWKSGGGITAGFYVYRSTHAHVPLSHPLNHLPLKKNVTHYVDKNVKAGSRYYYVVQAVGSTHGRTASRSLRSGTVKHATLIVTSVKATATSGKVNLLWAVRGTPQHVKIYRSTSTSVSLRTPVATPPPTKRSWVDTKVTNGTLYRYVVELVVGSRKVHSSAATATPVAAPSGVTATGGSAGITVAWAGGAKGVSSYAIYRSTSTPVSLTTPLHTASASATSWTDTTFTAGTTYYYVVQALSLHGHAETAATLTPAGAPVLKPTTSGDTKVSISWTAPSSGAGAVTSYQIFRGSSAADALAHAAVKTTAKNAFNWIDTGVTNGTTYFYIVEAVSNGGSANSGAQQGTPIKSPGVSIVLDGSDNPKLTWTASNDNKVTKYFIYRSTSSTVNTSPSGSGSYDSVDSSNHTYTDLVTTDSTTYYYRVQAFYPGGHAESGTVHITTPTPPPPPPPPAVQDLVATPGVGEVDLAWDMVDSSVTKIQVYISTGAPSDADPGTLLMTFNDHTTEAYVDASPPATTGTYFYVVRVTGPGGHADASAEYDVA
jgi:fibronectin type 3 domain-containing protein